METSSSAATYLEASSPPSNVHGNSSRTLQFRIVQFLQSPLQGIVESSGILALTRPDYSNAEAQPLASDASSMGLNSDGDALDGTVDSENGSGSSNNGEVSIRIYGGSGPEDDDGVEDWSGSRENLETSPYQRHDIQQATKLIEQILPFSLLLLVVFIRQHLQAFVVAIYITVILFKSNDILRKQTALKGERRISILAGYSTLFSLQVFGIYLWNLKYDLFYPLLMIPPKTIPPFLHAIFIILVNDTMVRQGSMVLKLVILMYYKNGNFRRQARMLTLVEYTLLLYRVLIPAPVWYRFFLNKAAYGSLFSSLTTGLYMTLKLTYVVEKVQRLVTALKSLSRKEAHYGSYATSEQRGIACMQQVNEAGGLCAICQQETMCDPIVLRCKHLFCEDCVSEWFERERTCPLCRALVRPIDLQSYGDGSTSLFFQFF